jgi:hypothetical protein
VVGALVWAKLFAVTGENEVTTKSREQQRKSKCLVLIFWTLKTAVGIAAFLPQLRT